MWNEFFRGLGQKTAIAVNDAEQTGTPNAELSAVMDSSNSPRMQPNTDVNSGSTSLIEQLQSLPEDELQALLNKTKTVDASEVKKAIQKLIDQNNWPLSALIIESLSGKFEIKVIQNDGKVVKK